jgi:NAD(P)-dependent dehydrogenase (short-subunit alcohol dehydrogenase family)
VGLDGYRIGVLDCDSPLCRAVYEGLRAEGAEAVQIRWSSGQGALESAREAFADIGTIDALVITQPAGWADGGAGAPEDGVEALADIFVAHRAIGEVFARQGRGQLVYLVTDQAYGDPHRPDLAAYHAAYVSLAYSLSQEWKGFLHSVNTVVLERPVVPSARWSTVSTVVGLLDLSVTGQLISISGAQAGRAAS